jgi:hypothetical protein
VFTYLLALIEMIPGTFWGVIIGAFFTLGGIILTNRAHDRGMHVQLTHDRDLKNREREMSLRKDVYLAAAEAASAGLISVGRFADLDIPHDKLTEGYLDKAPAITKVHIIANLETVRAVINFSSELNAAFLRLFTRRMPLFLQNQHIGFLRGQIDIFMKEESRMIELMKQYNIDGIHDPQRFSTVQKQFDFEQGRVEQTMQSIDTLNASLNSERLKLLEEVYNQAVQLGRLLTPALLSIRKELELPLDENEYSRISEEAVAKQLESLNEFIQHLRSAIAAQSAAAGGEPPALNS